MIHHRRVTAAAACHARGLYRPETERAACGVGFVAHVDGEPRHEVLTRALDVLRRLAHRGAVGADPLTGDGCGVLLQLPDAFFRAGAGLPFALPERGAYAVGQIFLPRDSAAAAARRALVERVLEERGLEVLGWRFVPVDEDQCGPLGLETLPQVAQVFVAAGALRGDGLEDALFRARKAIERSAAALAARDDGAMYVCSLSGRTLVYKGLLLPERLDRFYVDLRDPTVATALAVVHQRFSTNTFPSWERAHPYRLLAHNGEINTLRGNVGWMRARERLLDPDVQPVVVEGGSDSAMLDNALEMLVRTGRSVPHALAMMIPEAWENDEAMDPARRAFYAHHAARMEPWDGPALVVFSDGRVVGACLDRNGLRPARWVATTDGLVVLASEAGVVDVPAHAVARRDRLGPGEMLLVDTTRRELITDAAIKASLAAAGPWQERVARRLVPLSSLPAAPPSPARDAAAERAALRAHGYTREDLGVLLGPMARTGKEPIGAMGDDTALAVLSERPQLLFSYFKQLFAQVTNPPIDPIRERLVMSLRTALGPGEELARDQAGRQLLLEGPVLTPRELAAIEAHDDPALRAVTLPTLFPPAAGALGAALEELGTVACAEVRGGAGILVLTDRALARDRAAMPALLALAAVHQRLVDEGLRHRVGLVVDAGEPREVMHFCLLLGYGAGAICPRLALDGVAALHADEQLGDIDADEAERRYVASIHAGLLKVLSKMGISTLSSYRGAGVFEAVGLGPELVARFFAGTASRLGGLELGDVERESLTRHERAFERAGADDDLPWGGRYQWRRDGEEHELTPKVVGLLQHAVRSGDYDVYRKFARVTAEDSRRACNVRSLLEPLGGEPVPLEEVEPVSAIARRFRTGAMSFGSLSREAHETLAVAMNRIGARSNSGEGGEDPARYAPDDNGDWRRSAIKQVASGRFGVTLEYLLNADELQIKMAQGAKPGEGGHLPGHKVDEVIARVRHSTPGVGLISPPPHHDIYSIEDLAQLIHDLRCANDRAEISVKLVSEVGVGTVAAGVAKAGADHILISGSSGGTGASPLSSIKHAGLPWELGLAEAQQTLVVNDLRGRVSLEVDGQLKTGRDVIIAALLGAETFGFGTAALIASGCVLMRVCHLNTCPVGVATQDPELRARFAGQPEHVVSFMAFVARDVRESMARLGFRTVDEMIGRADRLRVRPGLDSPKARTLDLSRVLFSPDAPASSPRRRVEVVPHDYGESLDDALLPAARPAIEDGRRVELRAAVRNVHRTVGAKLSAAVVRRHGAAGLPDRTLELRLVGTAGQSFAAFLAPGLDVVLEGVANDAVGKGMCGGRVSILPPRGSLFPAERSVIVGNVALYGATGGELFVRGRAGERFAVRNSGATAVVEGVGNHGCEYMTGGTVVVLGPTGRNFAAGMSGGVAYVLDVDGELARRINPDMVELSPLDDAAEERVRALLLAHHAATRSAGALRVLSSWARQRARFLEVLPKEIVALRTTSRGDAPRRLSVI